MLDSQNVQQLEAIALRVREHIIRLSTDGGCFTGASLSCADLFVYLYKHYLRVDFSKLDDPNRDYLLLSKGHDVPALYGTFAELGYLEKDRLKNHLHTNDYIYWHPNRSIPGVEFYSGSLGHLPSVAIGIALDMKMRGGNNRVIVVTGDGELDEGSVWEAALVAAAYKLDNLVFVVDRNKFQANVATEELIPLEPIPAKFEAFGWATRRVNGHDFNAMDEAFNALPYATGKPSLVVCDTNRGQGLPSILNRADRWFCNFTHEEVEQLIQELHGNATTDIKSETLVVR